MSHFKNLENLKKLEKIKKTKEMKSVKEEQAERQAVKKLKKTNNKIKAVMACLGLTGSALLLSACSAPVVRYSPSDFITPNRVVTRDVKTPVLPTVKASYGIGSDPAVVHAYHVYEKTGQGLSIRGQGFLTYPYSATSKPVIACSMFHFCIVELEAGEKLNSYGLGDTADWQSNAFVTGSGPDASISIELKPVRNDLATDMTISTNKRTYLIGLVSKPKAGTTVLRFYYPRETMLANVKKANHELASGTQSAVISQLNVPGGTQIGLSHMNFNYRIKGDSPPWRPLRVFDDSQKTFIELPAIASRFGLPVLYLARGQKLEMVNYRYEKPYFIVDGLFSRAWLVSGKGDHQVRVEIINRNLVN